MRGPLNFIFDAIKRSIGVSIVGAVLLTMGVDLKEILIGLVKNPPWWAVDWWSSYVLVILGLWCIAWVFYRQTQAEIEKIRKPVFNVKIPDIIEYLRDESIWSVIENRHSKISPQAAMLEVNQKVRGRLVDVYGRRQINKVFASLEGEWELLWEPVLDSFPNYWKDMQVSSRAGVLTVDNIEETEPVHVTIMAAASFPAFTQLRAC